MDCVGSNETLAVSVNAVDVEFNMADKVEMDVALPGKLLLGMLKGTSDQEEFITQIAACFVELCYFGARFDPKDSYTTDCAQRDNRSDGNESPGRVHGR